MYRAMVVDDEEIIVNGLVRTMPWAQNRCEVVATARDGREALALFRQARPDLLFTDIQMPNVDGLTMIAALRSEFPRTQVTILSGYPNFAYAQRAIQLGVSGYVLKPSKFSQLEEALARMVAALDALPPALPASDLPALSASGAPDFADSAPAPFAAAPGDEPFEDEDVLHAQNFIVNHAMEYIRAHYAERLTLCDVADHVYVSQWHLSKLISRYTRQSFFALLNTVRIEKAKELLADPSLRVCEVSELVGFTDATHFSRTFKKLTGQSANEYRSNC